MATTLHGRYELLAGGRKLILKALQQLLDLPEPPQEVLILLADIASPDEVRTLLRQLVSQGTRVNWCTGSQPERVRKACHRLSLATVFTGSDLLSSFLDQYFPRKIPPIVEDLKKSNSCLEDFLRYKISLSFMCSLSVTPLAEGVRELAKFYQKNANKSFALSHLSPREKKSVLNFREADFPVSRRKIRIHSQFERTHCHSWLNGPRSPNRGRNGHGKRVRCFLPSRVQQSQPWPFSFHQLCWIG